MTHNVWNTPMFAFHIFGSSLRQNPSNSDKLRNGNINVPKRNGENPIIPTDSGGEGRIGGKSFTHDLNMYFELIDMFGSVIVRC